MKANKTLFVLLILLLHVFHAGLVSETLAMPPLDINKAPTPPDYAKGDAWLAKPGKPIFAVDVFYVYPTVLFDDFNWMQDPADTELRAAAKYCIDTQASVFDGMANVYAPMYRQMNIAVLGLSDTEASLLHEIVHDDVLRAFKYYLEHENNGRPFFLAGHSQGSMILTNLMLDHWGSFGAEDKLVAALLIGWSLTPEDLDAQSAVKMCDRSDRTRCVISYNTMAG